MPVIVFTHPDCLQHETGSGHPESPARLTAVLSALDEQRFAGIERIEAPLATREQLARVHADSLITEVLDTPTPKDGRRLDADTLMSPGSAQAALRAAGGVCAAVDTVFSGTKKRVFCAVRPPGHHATHDTAMGFCLFNSIAVGAAHALAMHGIERVAIVDFDVHHGNGSQDIFWSDPRVLYVSTHQQPLYPGTGDVDETGAGNILNVPLPAATGSAGFRAISEQVVLPALENFRPQLLMISAGFDAHRLDPLAQLLLETDDYAWITRQLVDVAERHAGGRVVSSLEGGYDLSALRACTAAHLAELANT